MTINSNLNASLFNYAQTRRDSCFETVLTKCVDVYNAIIRKNVPLPNDENTIRDEFLKYLQNLDFKKKHKLKYLKFDKETIENIGRADIRVLPTKDEYVNDEAYYTIECKRLDTKNVRGTTGMNAEYIKNGICRYVYDYYTSYNGVCAMFGFAVVPMNISQNIDNINFLLSKDYVNQQGMTVNANTMQNLVYTDFANGYLYSYVSKHMCKSKKGLCLYHLMFDLSQNIR